MSQTCPYKVPPFEPGHHRPKVVYYWWSWHPNYPYWSRSCWGGETVDKAWEVYAEPKASGLRLYHNKLIKEGDGKFTEVAEIACQDMEVWRKIARDVSGWRKRTDAKPIRGWNKK